MASVCVIAIRGQSAGANAMGWSTVALFALLAIGFGLILILKSQDQS